MKRPKTTRRNPTLAARLLMGLRTALAGVAASCTRGAATANRPPKPRPVSSVYGVLIHWPRSLT